ncbi:probable transcription factor At3g04930 [Impatiens glandulifera]|uniref:probable transcription factor At3g04930 n=1 Tax=Impatiens glandulifera TaxID=253017 RepID=UPI001FB0E9DA|nr:probable transcription factor At3g04930 [Impatiens glandulifera]
MPPIENEPVVCPDEDLVDDEDEDESEEEEYRIAPAKRLDEIEEDEVEEDPEEEEEDDDTSSSNLASGSEPILPHLSTSSQLTLAVSVAADPISSVQTVTIALPATDSSPDFKRQRIEDVTIPGINKPLKPLAVFDESRRLFQRLWTDEDEIELLQGFLDYTMNQRFNSGSGNGSSYHHDTSAFYDQIKNKLQLDFNKNQLVEKLRRVKKKYRTIISKIGSGNEYVFKSSHDEASFEICKKIWSTDGTRRARGRGGGLQDEYTNPNPNCNSNPSLNPNPNLNSANNRHNNISLDAYSSGKKSVGRPSSKRFRGGSVKSQQQQQQQQEVKPPQTHQFTTPTATTGGPTSAAQPVQVQFQA